MLNSMNALNLNYTQLRDEVVLYRTEQRQDYERIEEKRQGDWRRYEEDRRRDQEDHRRTFGPIYSYVAHTLGWLFIDDHSSSDTLMV
ncbi:unnamed protein product [Cuscuta europaea]|uniref:Uncharacterized protein n=1 Tax=Cuscuta europaea TaxID=41803 RepID=A0A9P0ZCC8_CUSEU|nr:unnamed protein product [Cuscuta europaea]